MSKRKREDEIESEISRIQNQALRIKVSRLKARFDHGVQQLTAQLKLARGFDRQKMTRRIKQAGSDESKLERLQAEVQVLKDVNERKVARNYLLKQCVRTKRIAEAEAFRSLFGGCKIKPSGSVAEKNVLARLFKSGPVSEVLPGIMKGFKEVVGAEKAANAIVGKDAGVGSDDVTSVKTGPVLAAAGAVEDDFEGFSDVVEGATSVGPDDQVIDPYDSRLAASSDDEGNSPEGLSFNGQNHDRDQDPMEITTDDDVEDDGDRVPPMSESEEELATPQSKPNFVKPLASLSADTSFLPSLMHGGYYSGSDSDADDNAPDGYDPDKAYAAAAAQPRKNRRGQRARQAIAEKKHGAKAKHLVKANGADGVHGDRQRFIVTARTIATNEGRNDGWDTRRGAVESLNARNTKGRRDTRMPNGSARRNGAAKDRNGIEGSTGANSDPVIAKARSAKKAPASKSGRIHPSWEAARKRKLERANAGPDSFTGKKITFE